MREAEAERRDCPPFKVMSDAASADDCQGLPASRRRPGPPRRRSVPGRGTRYAEALLAAVQRGLAASPRSARPRAAVDEATQLRFQRLREWRRQAAAARGVESDVILPREVAWEIAHHHPTDLDSLRRLMTPLENLFAAHGGDILKALTNGRPAAGRGK